jgi:hypothetical protein
MDEYTIIHETEQLDSNKTLLHRVTILETLLGFDTPQSSQDQIRKACICIQDHCRVVLRYKHEPILKMVFRTWYVQYLKFSSIERWDASIIIQRCYKQFCKTCKPSRVSFLIKRVKLLEKKISEPTLLEISITLYRNLEASITQCLETFSTKNETDTILR